MFRSPRRGWSARGSWILVEGNFVAVRTRMSGIFEREYAYSPIGPVQPTGKPVSFQVFNFFPTTTKVGSPRNGCS